MSDTKVRARKAKPSAAAPELSLAEQFMNTPAEAVEDDNVLSRERVPAKYRTTIESVIAKRSTSNSKYCYAVISYKKTKATKSLNLQYPACKVAPGTQFNIATLEFVTVLGDDGNEYLHLDGKPLTPTE